jgi:hypothetical protein
MTDGGFGPPIRAETDDGWGVLVSPYPSVERKKSDFQKTMARRAKVAAPTHHKDRSTVHGHVEAEDSKGSTCLQRDSILRVLEPVPRKSQDVIMILPSLRLGIRHFDRPDGCFFSEIGIRHGRPYHPSSVRVGTVTVRYVTVDGWGVRATYTMRSA